MYVLARAFAQCIVATFFGEVRAVGLERIPVCGPVIFVSNHNNKFVDASVIMACIPRSLRFLIATVSLKVRVVGRLAKFAGAIGVNRPQDMKYIGIGRIVSISYEGQMVESPTAAGEASPATKLYSIKGNDLTRFRLDCKKHDRIGFNDQLFLIEEVIDDHTLLATPKKEDPNKGDSSRPSSPSSTKFPTTLLSTTDGPNEQDTSLLQSTTQMIEEAQPKAAPDGAAPDGAAPGGAAPDGAAPDGAAPDGAAPDGAAPDGAAPDGAAPDGAAPDGEVIEETQVVEKCSVERGGAEEETLPLTLGSVRSRGCGEQSLTGERSSSKALVSFPFTVYPKVDQGDVYESVSRALYEGSSICIFPEGGSHDQPGLLPLKPGVAVMALNSASVGVEDVLIVPVGIHYFDRDKFGSQAVVDIGQPLALTDELLRMYESGNKKEAVKCLMAKVKEHMEDCLIYATSGEKLKVIELCASLYPPDRLHISVEKHHRLQALFTQLMNRLGADTKELETHVLEYGKLLEANGLQDTDVTTILSLNAESAALMMFQKLVPLLLLSVLVLPALALTYPLKVLSGWMTERHRSEALAKSNVKLTAVDVIASYKIVWCICFLPIIYAFIGLFLAIRHPVYCGASHPVLGVFLTFLAALLVQPILTYWGMRLRNKLPSYLKQIRCYYRVLVSELDVWRGGEREVMVDRIDLQLKVREFIKQLAQNTQTQNKRLVEIFNELENLIPQVIINTDTRRLMRQKDKLMPVVYRSAVMSREEIL